jgi:[methyl-Co(III) methanol-specific corrinoid protein]:coenzyme M methyltransferase
MRQFSHLRRVLSALLGGEVDRVPVTSIAGCGGTATLGTQEATGISLTDAHHDTEKMASLSLACHQLTGIENVRVPFDFVVEPEALGCEIKWWAKPELLPSVKTHPYKNPDDLTAPSNFLEAGRIPVVLKAITSLKEQVGDFLPISSLALGPFSLAGELAGVENLLIWTLKKPKLVDAFVGFSTELVIEYAKAQFRAGSNIVEVADAMASQDMISPTAFRRFVKPALTKIADRLGGIRVLHICGRTAQIWSDLVAIDFNGLSVEAEIAQVKPILGNMKILGNVSSKKTLVLGSPDDVKAEARKALEEGVDLLEPECGFSPSTPIENIQALVAARDEYYS